MANAKYFIESGISGTTSVWKVCFESQDEITHENKTVVACHLHGPMSATIALAAVERLNAKDYVADGWNQRLSDNLLETESE